jgi:hypothetical protein
MARIVPNHSAFEKRNDSRVTLSSSRNAVSFSSERAMKRFHRRGVRQQVRVFAHRDPRLKLGNTLEFHIHARA